MSFPLNILHCCETNTLTNCEWNCVTTTVVFIVKQGVFNSSGEVQERCRLKSENNNKQMWLKHDFISVKWHIKNIIKRDFKNIKKHIFVAITSK